MDTSKSVLLFQMNLFCFKGWFILMEPFNFFTDNETAVYTLMPMVMADQHRWEILYVS